MNNTGKLLKQQKTVISYDVTYLIKIIDRASDIYKAIQRLK